MPADDGKRGCHLGTISCMSTARNGEARTLRGPARWGVLAAVGAGVVLAACGTSTPTSTSGGSSAAATASSAATGAGSGSAPSSGSASTGSATNTGSAVPGGCTASQLTVSVATAGASAGHQTSKVTFENTSGTSCTLHGYPGLQLLDAAGAALPTDVVRGASAATPSLPVTTVTLAAGGDASFLAGWADATGYGGDTCPTSTDAQITAPNDYTSLTIPWAITPYGGTVQDLQCGQVYVTPVFAGKTVPGQ